MVVRRGIAPRLSPRKGDVLLLHQRTMVGRRGVEPLMRGLEPRRLPLAYRPVGAGTRIRTLTVCVRTAECYPLHHACKVRTRGVEPRPSAFLSFDWRAAMLPLTPRSLVGKGGIAPPPESYKGSALLLRHMP